VINTLVSQSLGATFNELIGQATPPKFRASLPTLAALVIEMIPLLEPQPQPMSQPPSIVTTRGPNDSGRCDSYRDSF